MHEDAHIIVKTRHPRRQRLLRLLLVLALAAVVWGAYEFGRYRAGFDRLAAAQEREELLEALAAMEAKNGELRARIAVLEQASEVDRLAYAEVDRNLKALQDEMLELREEVAFYRGIVGPADITKGLQIQSFMVKRNGETNTYRYRLIMTQYGKNTRPVQGVAKMRVAGVQDGKPRELELRDIDSQGRAYMKFRFKYFQELAGEMALPEGFVPLKVILKTIPQGKGVPRTERTFSWAEVIS